MALKWHFSEFPSFLSFIASFAILWKGNPPPASMIHSIALNNSQNSRRIAHKSISFFFLQSTIWPDWVTSHRHSLNIFLIIILRLKFPEMNDKVGLVIIIISLWLSISDCKLLQPNIIVILIDDLDVALGGLVSRFPPSLLYSITYYFIAWRGGQLLLLYRERE